MLRLPQLGSPRARLVSLVAGGNAAGQIITLAAAPVLARLYTPHAFGEFAIVVSITSVVAAMATLCFDQAIHAPAAREDAATIARLALRYAMLTSGASIALVATAIVGFAAPAHLWLLPTLIAANAFSATFSNLANREALFASLVRARLIGAVVGTIATLGLFHAGTWGLICGQTLGALASAVALGRVFAHTAPPAGTGAPLAELRRRFRSYPLWRLPADLINTSVSQVPLWIFGNVFGTTTAGYFSLVHRLYQAPVTLLGNALREVFVREAGAAYRTRGECATEFDQFARTLAAIGLLVCLPVVCFGPAIFAFVFGEPWREAGELARWLGVWYFLRFAISPLTAMLVLGTRLGLDLALQGVLLLGVAATWAYATATQSLHGTVVVLTAATFVFYGANYLISRGLARGRIAPGVKR